MSLDAEETENEVEGFDFDESFQTRIAATLLRDSTFARQVNQVLKPEFFTNEATSVLVDVVQDYIQSYKAAPGGKIVPMLLKDAIAKNRIRKDLIPDVKALVIECLKTDISSVPFVTTKVNEFARFQAIQNAMMDAIQSLDKKDFGAIEKLMKKALSVGVVQDSQDYDYWGEIDNRTKARHDIKSGVIVKRGITTGYAEMDSRLYHNGWGRRELSVMMGAAKAGKSMSLGDFTKNASLAGYNTLYVSLEVSAAIIADRTDAALSDTMISKLHVDPDDVATKLKAMQARAGAYRMREYASGTLKPSQLHRMIETYRNEGILFDLVTVDYADIMAAEYRSDKLMDNLREIYIDLRAIAHEFDLALLTATQTNRAGAGAVTAKATDVGDDFNKVRTADVLIGINATEAEKQVGEARLYWAASRNTRDGFTLRIKQDRSKMQFLTKVMGEE